MSVIHDDAELKTRHRATRAAGDYPGIVEIVRRVRLSKLRAGADAELAARLSVAVVDPKEGGVSGTIPERFGKRRAASVALTSRRQGGSR